MKQWMDKLNLGLIIASMVMIPVSTVSNVCFGILGLQGLILFIRQFKMLREDKHQQLFGLFWLLYWIPVTISLFDSVRFMKPFTHIWIGQLPYYFAGVFLIEFLKPNERKAIVLEGFFVGIIIWGVDGIIQLIFGRDLLGYELYSRVGGPFEFYRNFGYYFGPLSALILFYASYRKWPKYVGFLLYVFSAFVTLVGNTRAGWLMFFVVSVCFFFKYLIQGFQYKKTLIVGFLLAFILVGVSAYHFSPKIQRRVDQTTLAFQGDRDALDQALSGRPAAWIACGRIYKEHWINGVGPRCYRYVAKEYLPEGFLDLDVSFPHQVVLEFAVGMGTLGLIGLVGQYVICFMVWTRSSCQVRCYLLPVAVTLFAIFFPLSSHRDHLGTEHSMVCWLLITLFFAFSRPQDENDTSGLWSWKRLEEKEADQ